MVAGSARFDDLQQGVPKMSSPLLTHRQKELEAAAIINRRPV